MTEIIQQSPGSCVLKNVLLETGFEYLGQEVVRTKTASFSVHVVNGKIGRIEKEEFSDDRNLLLLPAFKDQHTHLDKTLFGLPWQAHLSRNKTVKDMIAYEQKMIPEWLKTSVERSKKFIDYYQSYGSDFARSHVNIESTSKLDSLYHLQEALDARKEHFEAELVAFPQHGLFYTPSLPYMREAAKLECIGFIGGLDPFSIDGSIEKSIDATVQMALDNGKGIDIHLHETGASGLQTIAYLIEKVAENSVLKGRTFISHAFVLSRLESGPLTDLAKQLAENQIGIISSVPFAGLIMPLPALIRQGVDVRLGTDNVQDHWSTFGSASMLRKVNLAAQIYGDGSEFQLSRIFGLATDHITPLDDKGVQQWPRAGDPADLILTEAGCSAEAVSRVTDIDFLIHQGNIVFKKPVA